MTVIEQINVADLQPLPRNFFEGDVETVAKALIGTFLSTVDKHGNRTGGKIVETEAYDEDDPAAHCHSEADKRRFDRSGSMSLEGGHAYVYSSRIIAPRDPNKQMWCLNFSSGDKEFGSAILIRALKPMWGDGMMRERRQAGGVQYLKGNNYLKHLCNGPAKLCEALDVTICSDGKSLFDLPFELYGRTDVPNIVCGPRIGVTKAVDVPRRYALDGSKFISVYNPYPLSADRCV